MTAALDMESVKAAYKAVPFSPFVPAKPTGKQIAFLANMGKEALYGGTARSMKSWAALMAALQYACVPGYSAIIFRKERASLKLPDGLIPISQMWLGSKAHWSGEDFQWIFPSGATLNFGYLGNEDDLIKYHSSAYQFVLFEEVAEWPTNAEYTYMFSRLTPKLDPDGNLPRCECHGWSVADIPLRMRATANPGGPGQGWVRENFILPSRAGKVGLFHPASFRDNPYIDADEYEQNLAKMRPIDRARLVGGDWDITAPGERFSRGWFKRIPMRSVPTDVKMIRRWDLAGTKVKRTNKDPDWTAGALVGHREIDGEDYWYIYDVVRFRATSGEVRRKMKVQSKVDDKKYKRHIPIRVEREPGAMAKMASASLKAQFKGFNFRAVPSRMSKDDRIDVLAVEAEVGEEADGGVFVAEGVAWAEVFFDEAEAYGNPGVHDDMLDAVSGAMTDLSKGAGSRSVHRTTEAAVSDADDPAGSGYPTAAVAGMRTHSPSGMSGGYADYV